MLTYPTWKAQRTARMHATMFFGLLVLGMLAVLLLPALAHADTAAPNSAVSGIIQMALAFAVDHLGAVVGIVLGLPVVSKLLDANRKRQVALAVYHAFHIVEDIDAETGGKLTGLEKVEGGLKSVDEYMVAQGWRPLKAGEQDVAKLTFKSLNAQANAAPGTDVPSPSKAPAAA